MNYKIKFNDTVAVITRNGERLSKIEGFSGSLKGKENVFDCDETGAGNYAESEFLTRCFKTNKYDRINLPFVQIFETVECLSKHFTYHAYTQPITSTQVENYYELSVSFHALALNVIEIKNTVKGHFDLIPSVSVKNWKQMLSIVKLEYLDSFQAFYDKTNGVLVLDTCVGARAMCRVLSA